ncbi:MAG: hypothetical protein QXO69_02870 [archaeon]
MAKRKLKEKAEEEKPIEIHPKKIAKEKVEELKQDTYAFIWLLFIVVLVAMSVYFKAYIKEMINVSILFLIFWYVEPMMFGATGTTVTTLLGRGKKVPAWKRFPLFFIVIILVYVLYNGIQFALNTAFPEESVNIVFIAMWLVMLFLLWVYKFSKELGVSS